MDVLLSESSLEDARFMPVKAVDLRALEKRVSRRRKPEGFENRGETTIPMDGDPED